MLFADCRNYTPLTRELGPQKVAVLMDDFFRTASEIVFRHNGIVDKFLGDACMALFNVPLKRPDHVAEAVGAATEIQLAVPRVNARFGDAAPLQVGIGISTGWAYVGTVGSHNCSDYTAMGDVVNVASRLQGQAAPGEVVVTEEAYAAIRTAFPNAKRREYELKGIDEPVVGYVLT